MRRPVPQRRLRDRLREEDGQALVEFALVIPLLLMVLVAIFDFAKAYNYWNDQTSLANIAARYAAVGSYPASDPNNSDPACQGSQSTLAAYVRCQAETSEQKNGSGGSQGVQAPGISVCISIADPPAVGNPVTVKVKSTYNWLRLPQVLGSNFQLAPSTITGSATMRLENIPPSGVGSIRTTAGACA